MIELFSLSCLLRLVGNYTKNNSWQQGKFLLKKDDFWEFLEKVQPWITGDNAYKNIATNKTAPFSYDDHYFGVENFEQLYLRLKDLL